MATRRCGNCGKTGHNARTCSSRKKTKKKASKKRTVKKRASKKKAAKRSPRTKGEWHEQEVSEKHLKKLANKDFTYVSVYIFDEDDPNYDTVHKFILWLSKPKAEIEKRAKKFIKRVYGKDYDFDTYPKNYVRKSRDLVALGLHEDASTAAIKKVFKRYQEQNRAREAAYEEAVRARDARITREKAAGTYNPYEGYTGTYIGTQGGAGFPLWRDTRGHVHMAEDWMIQRFTDGQKFRDGKPMGSLRGGRIAPRRNPCEECGCDCNSRRNPGVSFKRGRPIHHDRELNKMYVDRRPRSSRRPPRRNPRKRRYPRGIVPVPTCPSCGARQGQKHRRPPHGARYCRLDSTAPTSFRNKNKKERAAARRKGIEAAFKRSEEFEKRRVAIGHTPGTSAVGKVLRTTSMVGPCFKIGRITRETAQFYVMGKRRVKKNHIELHIGACTRCADHPRTVYPRGYDN